MIVVLVLLVCGFAAYLIYQASEAPAPPPDPEETLKAATELHRIRRRLDVAQVQHEQRASANQLRRDIAEALEADHDAP